MAMLTFTKITRCKWIVPNIFLRLLKKPCVSIECIEINPFSCSLGFSLFLFGSLFQFISVRDTMARYNFNGEFTYKERTKMKENEKESQSKCKSINEDLKIAIDLVELRNEAQKICVAPTTNKMMSCSTKTHTHTHCAHWPRIQQQ